MSNSTPGPAQSINITELQRRFSVPGVKLDAGKGGLPRVVVQTPRAAAEIYLHGAHITHFQPAGAAPVLFLSEKSLFTADKPIRGGIPLIFPWFGPNADDPSAPMHGFARTTQWSLAAVTQLPAGAIEIELILNAADINADLRRFWPHDFSLRLMIRVADSLEVELQVSNTSSKPFQFEEALHTYFSVGDVRQVSVAGLEKAQYISKVEGGQRKTQTDPLVRITGETDRVYLNTTVACTVRDPSLGRQIIIDKVHSNTTVVWNPWIDKAKAMPDFGDEEWPRMLCIETCNAMENKVELPPGEKHVMRAKISIQK